MKRHKQLSTWRYINKILLYYNNTCNFLQIIVMIIIYIIIILFYNIILFARANALSNIYIKKSHAETCRLAVFCVKLSFYSDFTVPLGGRRSCSRELRVWYVMFLR